MEEINPFDDLTDSGLQNPDILKEMLVSEITTIRETLSIVNLFFGEALISVVNFIQVFEPKSENQS